MAIVGHVAVKFTGNSAGFVDSVRQAIAALAGLNKAFYDSEAAAKVFSKALSGASPALDAFNKISIQTAGALKNQTTLLNTISASFTKFDSILTKLGGGSLNTLNNVAAALNKVTQAATQVGQQAPAALNNVNNALNQTGSAMKKVESSSMSLRTALGGISAGFVAKTLISNFADFEHQLNQVLKLVKPGEFEKVTKAFRDVSSVVPTTTDDLSKAGQELLRMGFSANEFAEGLKTAAQANIVLGDSANETLVKTTRLNSVMGEGNDKLRESLNVLTGVADALTTNQAEIIHLASRWAQAGKAFKLSKEEIVAWSGVMRAANVNAEAGATAMSELVEVMVKASQEGGKELQTLSEMTGLTRQQFVDLAASNPSKILEIFFQSVKNLNTSPEGLVTLLKHLDVLGLDSQRISRVLAQTGGAVDLYGKAIEGANRHLKEGDLLTKQAEVSTRGLSSQWDILKNSLKAASSVLLKDVGGALTDSIKKIADFVRGMGELDKGTTATVQNLVKMAAEFAGILTAMYAVITVSKLVAAALLAMTPVGWAATIVAGVTTLLLNLDKVEAAAKRVGIALKIVGSQATESQKAVENLHKAQKEGADQSAILEHIKGLQQQKAKLEKFGAGFGSPVEAANAPKALKAIDDELDAIKAKYKDVKEIQIQVSGLDTVDNLSKKLDDVKKKREEAIAAKDKPGFHFAWQGHAATIRRYDDEIKKTEDLIIARKKIDALKPPAPVAMVDELSAGTTASVSTGKPSVAPTTTGVGKKAAPDTESQKMYKELEKSLDIIEKKFKATGDEEDRLKERSKVLKKALDDIAEVTDETASKLLPKVGQQYKENEAALDKFTNVTKKAVKDTADFNTNVNALTKTKQLLGVPVERVQQELSLYKNRLEELLKTEGASQQEIANTTAKIKELEVALTEAKAVEAQKKIMDTLAAAFDNAANHGGTFADKVNEMQQRVTALNTAFRAMHKLLGENAPQVQELGKQVAEAEKQLADAKGQQKYQDLLEKIKMKTMEAEEQFGAFGDTQAYLKEQVDIATFSLLNMYKTFGEGSEQVLQARDDLLAAKNAMDIFTTGQQKYDAIIKGLDKNAKEEEKVWKKLADTIMGVTDQIGESLANMVLGVKTTKEEYQQTLKELLKIIIKFVIQAVAQFIILSIVGGGQGSIGQRIGQSISAGISGNISTTLTPKAQGGVLTRPTTARLAERGPEAVIPLQNGSVPVTMQGGMGGGLSTGDIDHPFEVTIINVVEKSKAEGMARDKKAIINVINEDIESRGSTYRSVRGVSKAR